MGRVPSERSERRLAVDSVGEPKTRGCIAIVEMLLVVVVEEGGSCGASMGGDGPLFTSRYQFVAETSHIWRAEDPVDKDDIEPVTR